MKGYSFTLVLSRRFTDGEIDALHESSIAPAITTGGEGEYGILDVDAYASSRDEAVKRVTDELKKIVPGIEVVEVRNQPA